MLLRVALLLSLIALSTATLEIYTASGTRRQVGRSIGRQTKTQIDFCLSKPYYLSTVLPFLNTTAGLQLYGQMLSRATQLYPRLIDEIAAIAQGSGRTFKEIFTLNAMDEIENYLSNLQSQCTDVIAVDSENRILWGHNEDAGPTGNVTTFLVNITIYADNNPTLVVERFMAFSYAGFLGGQAFGWNHHGMVFTRNAVFANKVAYNNAPSQIVCRYLYSLKSPEEVIAHLAVNQGAFGFSLSFANLKSKQVRNIEVDPLGTISIHRIHSSEAPQNNTLQNVTYNKPLFIHTNIYEVLNSSCFPDPSSYARLATLRQYAMPQNFTDIRTMLGDTSNAAFPVYRTPSNTDQALTVATALFHFERGVVDVYDVNPKDARAPGVTLPLVLQ